MQVPANQRPADSDGKARGSGLAPFERWQAATDYGEHLPHALEILDAEVVAGVSRLNILEQRRQRYTWLLRLGDLQLGFALSPSFAVASPIKVRESPFVLQPQLFRLLHKDLSFRSRKPLPLAPKDGGNFAVFQVRVLGRDRASCGASP